MNIIIYLVAAAIVGWVASEIMHDRASLLMNILVGVVGAFLAGYFLSPIFKVGTINDAVNLPTMLVTLAGRHHRDRARPSHPSPGLTRPAFARVRSTRQGCGDAPLPRLS